MRFIGNIADNADATRFGDYLTSLGIGNTVESGGGGFSIWVHDDDHLDRARGELEAFGAQPGDAKYGTAVHAARRIRDAAALREQRLRRNFIDYRTSWAASAAKPMPLTLTLVILCGIAAAATKLGAEHTALEDWLRFGTISDAERQAMFSKELAQEWRRVVGAPRRDSAKFTLMQPGLEQIRRGQVWRIVTPTFLHFGILHLAFNMLWLVDLGGIVERRRGTLVLLGLVLITGAIGNILQFYWSGPYFGGMSGVVYGLFGYVWVKSRVEPQLGMQLHSQTVIVMIAWLLICMSGVMNLPVANAAHVGGLLSGAALAHAPYSWRRMRRARRSG